MKHKHSIISIALASIMLVSLCAVCASTSVSAATSSNKASVTATPDLVGSPIASGTGPAACVLDGSNLMYVFVKGYDGALWYRTWNTALSSWELGWKSLGGQLTSSPAAVSSGGAEMLVFVRGTNGAVYEKELVDGAWQGFVNLGGVIASGTGPAASGWQNHVDIFVQGTTGALYQKTYDRATGWTARWANLGGKLTSSPCAVSPVSNYIYVYVAGTNGVVYEASSFSGLGWHWYSLGGKVAPGTGPTACFYGTGREDVFVEGTNGALYQTTWIAPSTTFSNWVNLGGKLSASPTAATFMDNGAIDIEVFVRGSTGLIYQKEFYDSSWHNWLAGIQGPP